MAVGAANQHCIKHIKPVSYGGGYCFKQSNNISSACRNRFLYWKIYGSSLELCDVSLDLELVDGNLKIIFQDAIIASEPGLFETQNSVVLLVSTSTGIYRFIFPHPDTSPTAGFGMDASYPSIFSNASLSSCLGTTNYHMFGNLPSVQQFVCGTNHHTADDTSVFSFSNQTGSVTIFKLPPPHSFSTNVSVNEIKQVGVMSRILGGLVTSVVGNGLDGTDACSSMCTFQDQVGTTLVCGVTWDFKLKLWTTDTHELLLTEDILSRVATYFDRSKYPNAGSKNIVRIHAGNQDSFLIGVFVNIPNNMQFHIYHLKYQGLYLWDHLKVFYGFEEDLIDFMFDSEMMWTLWMNRDSQPVIRFERLFNDSVSDMNWTKVLMNPGIVDEVLIPPGFDPKCAYLDYIFHPGRFNSLTILKALAAYKHSPGNVVQKMKFLSRKALKEEVCRAVEEQIRMAASDADFEMQESDYLDLQMQQWTRLYSSCFHHYERSKKVIGLFKDNSTGLVVAVKESDISVVRPCGILEQLYSNEISPSLKDLVQFCPNIKLDKHSEKSMEKLSKCLKLISSSMEEEGSVWNDPFGSFSFDPLQLATRHVQQLKLSNLKHKLDACIQDLGSSFSKSLKILIDLLEDISPYVSTTDSEDEEGMLCEDGEMAFADEMRKIFSSGEGMRVLCETIVQSVEAKFKLSRDLLVITLCMTKFSLQAPGSSRMELECSVGRLTHLVNIFHATLWAASTTVLSADLCSVENTKKELGLLNLFKHECNFSLLASAETSMTLLELYILVQSREDNLKKLESSMKSTTYWKLWLNALPVAAELISSSMRPDTSNLSFPIVLLNCCQHLHLQHYIVLISSFCKQDLGTFKFLSALVHLASNEPRKAYDYFVEARQFVGAESFLMNLVSEADPQYMETVYCLNVMNLFEEFEYPSYLVELAKYTIEVADVDDPHLVTVWMKIFKSELELENYEEAYEALFRNPDSSRCKDCLRQFLAVLCEKKEYAALVNLTYKSRGLVIEHEAVSILESRARLSKVSNNNFYELLYAFHIKRRNFKSAAAVMYECATRWGSEVQGLDGLENMVEYLVACHNCLLLIDPVEYAWVVKPLLLHSAAGAGNQNETFNHSIYGNETKNVKKRGHVEVYDIKDVEKELLLSSSLLSIHQLPYVDKIVKTIPLRAVSMKPEEMVVLLCKYGLYNKAFHLSDVFGLSPVPVFESLTLRCVNLSTLSTLDQPFYDSADLSSNWVDYNEDQSILIGNKTTADRAWELLRIGLEKYEKPHSTRSHKSCAVKMFQNNFPLPSWLASDYKKLNPGELMMLYCTYDLVQEAADLAIEYIEAVAGKGKDYFGLEDYLHAGSTAVWLPYRVLDSILYHLDCVIEPPVCLIQTKQKLEEVLGKHFKHVQHCCDAVKYLQTTK